MLLATLIFAARPIVPIRSVSLRTLSVQRVIKDSRRIIDIDVQRASSEARTCNNGFSACGMSASTRRAKMTQMFTSDLYSQSSSDVLEGATSRSTEIPFYGSTNDHDFMALYILCATCKATSYLCTGTWLLPTPR